MCGTYRTTRYDLTLTVEDGRAFLIRHSRTARATSLFGRPGDRVEVVRLGDSAVITARPAFDGHRVLSLIGSDQHGRARFLHNGAAAYRVA
ncbi:hypothetical protein [Streptacidiphilus neutrinimicus]|uniref:hypothetical protein n=1 Tax=Streptacidiphilus neutrinimicus TaxID=105420 RepID=UPI0005A8FA89|nr:hypothetical protein [Streptacidiphilus neutrinimicus]